MRSRSLSHPKRAIVLLPDSPPKGPCKEIDGSNDYSNRGRDDAGQAESVVPSSSRGTWAALCRLARGYEADPDRRCDLLHYSPLALVAVLRLMSIYWTYFLHTKVLVIILRRSSKPFDRFRGDSGMVNGLGWSSVIVFRETLWGLFA